MGLDECAVPSRIARAIGKRICGAVVHARGTTIDDVSKAGAEPLVIRPVLGENLEVQFGAEVKQAFEAYAAKILVADAGTLPPWSK